MTIRDLVSGADGDLEGMEIVVREGGKGRWIQGYRISKKAELYPIDSTIENRELYPWVKTNSHGDYCCDVPEGETLVVHQPFRDFPIKIMCIDPKKAPKEILDLEVSRYLPRNIPVIHGLRAFNNEFSLEIWAYLPEPSEKPAIYREVKKAEIDDQLEGQMSIEDYLGGNEL